MFYSMSAVFSLFGIFVYFVVKVLTVFAFKKYIRIHASIAALKLTVPINLHGIYLRLPLWLHNGGHQGESDTCVRECF